jgi:imidazoleglycerol-phosphate dehydratase
LNADNCALFFARHFDSMVAMKARQSKISRNTNETKISVSLNLDGKGNASVKTGIAFFDHMLTLFAKHATVDLKLVCDGDLEVDAHHTVEDCGIALGQAFTTALGDKKGIRRYGFGFEPQSSGTGVSPVSSKKLTGKMPVPLTGEAFVPMDECLARCVVDFGGRPHLVWRGLDKFSQKNISDTEKNQDVSSAFRFGLAREFFQGFANEARCNLHLELLYGDEPHHIVEALFKAFARAVDAARRHDPRIAGQLPSTKGKL